MTRNSRIAVLLAGLVVLLTGCTDSGDAEGGHPRAKRGDVVKGRINDLQGRAASITVPGTRYNFLVGTPRDHIDADLADGASVSSTADDSTRFVGVAWTIEPTAGGRAIYGFTAKEPSSLSLLVDGDEYPVGNLDELSDDAYVVVPAEAKRIGVSLEFDGLTQTVVDLSDPTSGAGGSSLLHTDVPRQHSVDCPGGRAEPTGYAIANACVLDVTSPLAYHAAVGWAPDGRGWMVADLTLEGFVASDDPFAPETHHVDGGTMTVRLDGAKPRKIVRIKDESGGIDSWHGQAFFEVDPDGERTLTIRRAYVATAHRASEAAAAGAPRVLRRTYAASIDIA